MAMNSHRRRAGNWQFFWANKLYLIIDESFMISRKFFARISVYMAKGKSLVGEKDTNKSFGGVNVVLVGDLHQFPLSLGGKMHRYSGHVICLKIVHRELLGRNLYEEFRTVLRLKEQFESLIQNG